MPLHLLSKKSWNVYAPDNIARVKRDEAAAAAAEEEADRRLQEYEAERRLAILRGEEPPALPPPTLESGRPELRREERGHGADRKRKRIAGEDDTERDLRIAREDMQERNNAPLHLESKRPKKNDAPLIDHTGHINLFPIDAAEQLKNAKNPEAEAEKARKDRELEDQYTMRLANAAGRDGLAIKPWYTSSTSKLVEKSGDTDATLALYADEKNAWGRPDPRRKDRDKARISSNDPLAFMSKAQEQLKQSEKDRRKWEEERERDMERLKREAERKERKGRRERKERRRKRDGDGDGGVVGDGEVDLEGFSLDAPAKEKHSRNRRDRKERNSENGSHLRERERERDRHQKRRSHDGRHHTN